METTQKNTFLKHRSKKLRIVLPVVAVLLIVGVASAAIFTMYYTSSTATVKTPDVQLLAGSDSTTSPTVYPAATVTVASTKDYAGVSFSLFPSATNTPQPATFYTDLVEIKNTGTAAHTLNSITISSITGASNLGGLTIYLYATQTNSPETGTPIASMILTSTSTGTVTLLGSASSLAAGATDYVEVVGYAASGAAVGSTVGFATAISWT